MPQVSSQAAGQEGVAQGGWNFAALRARAWRFAGYTFWSGAAVALPLALDRLVISPWLNRAMGEALFGGFVWAMGIVNLCGLPIAAGAVSYLMRQHAEHTGDDARSMLRTTLTLSTVAAGAAVAAGIWGCLWIADATVLERAAAIFVPLGLLGLLRCLETVLIGMLRMERRYIAMFLLKVLETAVLLGVVWAFTVGGVAGAGAIYALSAAAPVALSLWMVRGALGRGRWCEGRFARAFAWSVPALTATGLIEQALFYLPRLVLGTCHSPAEVTLLFAGASIGALFLTPVALSGGVVLALLAPRREFALHGRLGWIYLGLALLGGVVLGLASYFIGRYLVAFLYPDQAERALTFYHWIAIANGFTAAIVLLRPVTVRYAATRSIVGLSLITVLSQLALLLLWTPGEAAAGAARAAAVASVIGLACWTTNYLRLLRSSRGPSPEAIPVEAAE